LNIRLSCCSDRTLFLHLSPDVVDVSRLHGHVARCEMFIVQCSSFIDHIGRGPADMANEH
jgi:hypothetical protein